MIERAALLSAFRAATGHDAEVAAFAPGRANLIGEHTDYNEGFVLPAAIDRGVAVAARRVPGETFTLQALDLGARCTFPRGRFQRDPDHPWANYFQGVIWALSGRGLEVPACEAAVTGDLPRGAGLSSSAAYEVATALVLRALGNLALSSLDVAKLAREAENGFVGVACGIMDQMASTFGAAGSALLLDCRSLAHQTVEIPAGLAIVVAGSGVHHELASSEYNKRRAECEEGVRILSSFRAGVRALRDVEPEDETRFFPKLPPIVRQRCRHVVSENARVLEAVKALRAGDLAKLKTLLAASHFSLRDDYQVSCPELDVLVDLALAHPACHGARLTGAGFGGSTVNLVDAGAVAAFSAFVSDGYQRRVGRAAEVHVFKPSAGARLL
ncbi:MAG TPA: galactokinase [Polyangia bacterium]|jgi:galactokinase